MGLTVVLIWTCMLISALSMSDIDVNAQLDDLEQTITESRASLARGGGESAEVWARLGFALKRQIELWDKGGTTNLQMLEAFQRASSVAQKGLAKEPSKQPHWMRQLACVTSIEAARTLIRMHRYEDALERVEDVLVLSEDDPRLGSLALHEQGNALTLLGQREEAASAYEFAIRLWPPFTQNHMALARSLVRASTKKMRDLVQATRKAEEMQIWGSPSATEALYHAKTAEENMGPFEDELSVRAGPAQDTYYALGIAYHRLGEHSEAWSALLKGHEHVRNSSIAAAHDYHRETASTQRIFQKSFWPSGVGLSSTQPIFMLGMPRAGSSVLDFLLCRHSMIRDVGHDSIFSAELPHVRDNIVTNLVSAVGREDDRDLRVREAVDAHAARILIAMRAKANGSYDYSPAELQAQQQQRRQRRSGDEREGVYLLDKMVSNFHNVGLIHLLYPQATLIHVVRDPLDTIVATFRDGGRAGVGWSTDLDELVSYYIAYLHMMAHWRNALPGRIVDVQYEEIVFRPNRVARGLVQDVLGLQWEEKARSLRPALKLGRRPGYPGEANTAYSTVLEDADPRNIGVGRRYKSLIPAHTLRKLSQELKLLHQSGSLPFADSVNWHLEADFDYEQQFPNSDDDGDRPLNLDRPRWVSPSWDGVGQRVVVE